MSTVQAINDIIINEWLNFWAWRLSNMVKDDCSIITALDTENSDLSWICLYLYVFLRTSNIIW
jgi:hypothetical protein